MPARAQAPARSEAPARPLQGAPARPEAPARSKAPAHSEAPARPPGSGAPAKPARRPRALRRQPPSDRPRRGSDTEVRPALTGSTPAARSRSDATATLPAPVAAPAPVAPPAKAPPPVKAPPTPEAPPRPRAPAESTRPTRPPPRARRRRETITQRHPWAFVAALALLALGIRLLLVRGVWVDEAISVNQAGMSLPDMLDDLRAGDNHPPLYPILLWLCVRVLDAGELAVRIPSIIAGTALVPALFLAGRELFDRRAGLVAAGLGALAPLLVWYSQEARMYVLFMLLATLAVWAQARVLNDGRARWWVAYGGFTVALLYTHYFALIPIGIQQIAFAAIAWRRARNGEPVRDLMIGYWLTWLALVVAAAPLAPFAADQFQNNQETGFTNAPSSGDPEGADGSSASVYAVISNLAWAIWGYHGDSAMLSIAALWPLLMLASLLALGRGRSPSLTLVLALAFGPVIAMLGVGLFKRELFEVRYFAGAVPMILLLLARAATAGGRRLAVMAATLALSATLVVGLLDQQLGRDNPRDYDFRGAMAQVRDQVQPGDTVLYAPGFLRDVISYYAPGAAVEPLRTNPEEMPKEGRVFVIASFLEDPGTSARVDAAGRALTRSGRREARDSEHARIRTIVYK